MIPFVISSRSFPLGVSAGYIEMSSLLAWNVKKKINHLWPDFLILRFPGERAIVRKIRRKKFGSLQFLRFNEGFIFWFIGNCSCSRMNNSLTAVWSIPINCNERRSDTSRLLSNRRLDVDVAVRRIDAFYSRLEPEKLFTSCRTSRSLAIRRHPAFFSNRHSYDRVTKILSVTCQYWVRITFGSTRDLSGTSL